MGPSKTSDEQIELLTQITDFVGKASGLRCETAKDTNRLLRVRQTVDGKAVMIAAEQLEDVLFRVDADGQDFIQINFASGQKILMTTALIGFKPAKLPGLSTARLPKVVTTPDIISVFEAIQEALHTSDPTGVDEDLTVLRRVFEAVVSGGEEAGFDLQTERSWIRRIPAQLQRATA